jgi:hypothetical protein
MTGGDTLHQIISGTGALARRDVSEALSLQDPVDDASEALIESGVGEFSSQDTESGPQHEGGQIDV